MLHLCCVTAVTRRTHVSVVDPSFVKRRQPGGDLAYLTPLTTMTEFHNDENVQFLRKTRCVS